MKGQMWGHVSQRMNRTHSIYGFGLWSGRTSVCLLCLHWHSMICGCFMFRRKWFSWFVDTAKTADGFGFAHGASRTSVLDNSVGHCDRQWQMVRSCSLGDICTDRDYTLAGGLCAHTHMHGCKHSVLMNHWPHLHAKCSVGQFSKWKNITPKVFLWPALTRVPPSCCLACTK